MLMDAILTSARHTTCALGLTQRDVSLDWLVATFASCLRMKPTWGKALLSDEQCFVTSCEANAQPCLNPTDSPSEPATTGALWLKPA